MRRKGEERGEERRGAPLEVLGEVGAHKHRLTGLSNAYYMCDTLALQGPQLRPGKARVNEDDM